MAYSSGFNPHPRISYAGAAPTGSASEAEYLELALAQVVVPRDVHAMLDEALPPGLDVLEVVESSGGSLSDLLEGSRWRIAVDADAATAADAVSRFLAADEALVERMTKKGMREFDARGAVVSLVVLDPEDGRRRAYDARRGAAPRHPGRTPRRRAARARDRRRAGGGGGPADDPARPGAAARLRRGRRPAGASGIAPGRGRCAILATFDALATVRIRRADDVLAGHSDVVGTPGGWTSPDRDAATESVTATHRWPGDRGRWRNSLSETHTRRVSPPQKLCVSRDRRSRAVDAVSAPPRCPRSTTCSMTTSPTAPPTPAPAPARTPRRRRPRPW